MDDLVWRWFLRRGRTRGNDVQHLKISISVVVLLVTQAVSLVLVIG